MFTAIALEVAAFTVFGALSFVFHDKAGQPLFRRDFVDDALYFLLGLLVYGRVIEWIDGHVALPPAAHLVGAWPLGLQALVIVVAYDAMQYGLHRVFHGDRLWRFHAVHHSAEEIDILTSFRTHPVNFLIYSGVPTIVLLLLGFSPAAFALLAPFNFFMGCLTHANLSWTFGPLRYGLASPMFHRWHHAVVDGEPPRNLSPNFPLWDLIFGTFYMPRHERPKAYGAPDVPSHFVSQLTYPFGSSKLNA